MNSFGRKLIMTTFGESHGTAIGCTLDGVPAGLKIDMNFIQDEMNRRKPGKTELETSRKEDDLIEIISGVFEGLSTGTPITIIIKNTNTKSKDYDSTKDLFRPGHADITYFEKYGIRDYRGGGRSSARETASRVAAGAIAKLILKELNISIQSGLLEVDGIKSEEIDFDFSKKSLIYSLDKNKDESQKEAILKAKNNHDSVGGVVITTATNVPSGLGEPMYYKLDAIIAAGMMGINAVKAVEIGLGIESTSIKGSENNDKISINGFNSNNSGGILGGISNGDTIIVKSHFKPTPSIFIEQETLNTNYEEDVCKLKGRHDPCVAIRGSVVTEAMLALVLADMVLLNMTSKISNIKKVYS